MHKLTGPERAAADTAGLRGQPVHSTKALSRRRPGRSLLAGRSGPRVRTVSAQGHRQGGPAVVQTDFTPGGWQRKRWVEGWHGRRRSHGTRTWGKLSHSGAGAGHSEGTWRGSEGQ